MMKINFGQAFMQNNFYRNSRSLINPGGKE